MARARASRDNGATLGFEATLWAAADKLRGHVDAAEYKHVVLGLIFLTYNCDAFEAPPPQLLYGTQIPACLWFLARDKSGTPTRGGPALRDRRGETIARTYHAWRGEQ